jgi:hypothetical protein
MGLCILSYDGDLHRLGGLLIINGSEGEIEQSSQQKRKRQSPEDNGLRPEYLFYVSDINLKHIQSP